MKQDTMRIPDIIKREELAKTLAAGYKPSAIAHALGVDPKNMLAWKQRNKDLIQAQGNKIIEKMPSLVDRDIEVFKLAEELENWMLGVPNPDGSNRINPTRLKDPDHILKYIEMVNKTKDQYKAAVGVYPNKHTNTNVFMGVFQQGESNKALSPTLRALIAKFTGQEVPNQLFDPNEDPEAAAHDISGGPDRDEELQPA